MAKKLKDCFPMDTGRERAAGRDPGERNTPPDVSGVAGRETEDLPGLLHRCERGQDAV